MSKITFENKAVAFIDVLGFSSLVDDASKKEEMMAQLQSLVDLFKSVVPELDKTVDKSVPLRLIPKHIYISDSIILSAPLSDSSVPGYNGLEVLVMRCIQLTHHFLSSGYLLRGGIAIGKVWHGTSNIVGPAYQEAYKLENNPKKKLESPCILLSESSVKKWNHGLLRIPA